MTKLIQKLISFTFWVVSRYIERCLSYRLLTLSGNEGKNGYARQREWAKYRYKFEIAEYISPKLALWSKSQAQVISKGSSWLSRDLFKWYTSIVRTRHFLVIIYQCVFRAWYSHAWKVCCFVRAIFIREIDEMQLI